MSTGISLSAFTKALATRDVNVRGIQLTVRPVTAAEAYALEKQYPVPQSKGRTAEERESMASHKEYIAAMTHYIVVRKCIMAMIAADLARENGEMWNENRDIKWLNDAANELQHVLGENEIERIVDAQDEAQMPDEKDAGTGKLSGNSSALPQPNPPPATDRTNTAQVNNGLTPAVVTA